MGAPSDAAFSAPALGSTGPRAVAGSLPAPVNLPRDLARAALRHLESAYDRRRIPNPLVNCYRSSDGRWFWLLGLQGDRHWPDPHRTRSRGSAWTCCKQSAPAPALLGGSGRVKQGWVSS